MNLKKMTMKEKMELLSQHEKELRKMREVIQRFERAASKWLERIQNATEPEPKAD